MGTERLTNDDVYSSGTVSRRHLQCVDEQSGKDLSVYGFSEEC